MFFELNDEQREFQKRVRGIFEREVRPLVEEYERKEAFPTHLFRILGGDRLLCLRCPQEYDGLGLDKVSECISVEELNRICAGIGSSIMVHGGLASIKDASIVKLFCTESVQQIVQKAMVLQKKAGLVTENPVQRFLRDARLLKIPEGTSEIQHLIIAKELGI